MRVDHANLYDVVAVLEPVDRLGLVERGEFEGNDGSDDAGDVDVFGERDACAAILAETASFKFRASSAKVKPVCNSSHFSRRERSVETSSTSWGFQPIRISPSGAKRTHRAIISSLSGSIAAGLAPMNT